MRPKRSAAELVVRRNRYYRLVGLSVLAGVCGGVPAVVYRITLTGANGLRQTLFGLAVTPLRAVLLILLLLVVGAAAGRITQGEPLIAGSGIPQVKGQLQGWFAPNWPRVLLTKFVGGALCIFGGLALGREGPSVQLGAMASQGMAEKLRCSPVEKKYLVTCGACGGLAAAFNAPLAGMMFGLEEIHKNFSALAMFPTMVAAIIADLISKAYFGTSSSMNLGLAPSLGYLGYLLFAIMGILMGLFGVLYNKTLLSLQKGYRRLPVPVWVRIMIPFAFAGALGFCLPQVLGPGNSLIAALSDREYTLAFTALLLIGRFVFSMISFCSGAPGGIFFPLLVLGALAGCVCGKLAVLALGLPVTCVVYFMVVGMAGLFAAIVRAPITGIILVMEMSGSLTQLAGVTIAVCCATLVANGLGSQPIYESLLDGLLANGTREVPKENDIVTYPVPLESTLVGRAMRELEFPQSCLVISVVRGLDVLIPRGEMVLQAGDFINIACPMNAEWELREFLNRTGSGGESRRAKVKVQSG